MRVTLFIGAALVLSSIALIAGQRDTFREHDARWTAPPAEAARTNPVSNQPGLSAGGRKLFEQRCSTCHGEDAAGTANAPNLTRTVVQRQSDGALFWKISSGNTRTGMPTFSFLPPLQRWQLVLFIRSQSNPRSSTAIELSDNTNTQGYCADFDPAVAVADDETGLVVCGGLARGHARE